MERITRFRALAVLLIFALVLSVFSVRMYQIQVVDSSGVVNNTSTYKSYYTIKAARGNLLDRNGNPLVSNRASYNLVFNNFVLTQSDDPNGHLLKLVRLCEELGAQYIERFPVTLTRPYEYTLVDQSAAWQGYFQDYLWDMGIDSDISAPLLMNKLRDYYDIPDDWTDEEARKVIGIRYELRLRTDITNLAAYVFLEDVPEDVMNAILELNVPGLDAQATTTREYATAYLAHILGTMTKIDAESWPTYKELGYSMDDYVGDSGLEGAFEQYLHGTDGQLVREVDKNGNIISQRYTLEPIAGNNVETTIDLPLQIVAEDALAAIVKALHENNGTDGAGNGADVEGCAVVVQMVDTGEILACASYPTYDLTTYNSNYNELISDPLKPTKNRAVAETYPPGSTFKMVMATAGLESGAITRYTEIRDKGIFTKYTRNGPKCLIYTREGKTHGSINVVSALEDSCNYFFYALGDMMDWDVVDATAKSFGLGEKTGVEIFEYVGHRANAETKAELYTGSETTWYPGDQVLASIGQSDNRFTVMQMAGYTSTIANGGTRYAATFLNRVVSSDYSTLVLENEPQVLGTALMSAETQQIVVEGMRAVVTQGTAANVFRGFDVAVCGKTGTAETGIPGASSNAAFVCFAPADDPQIAIAVYGEKVGSGAYMARVAKTILEYYFSADTASDIVTSENQIG